MDDGPYAGFVDDVPRSRPRSRAASVGSADRPEAAAGAPAAGAAGAGAAGGAAVSGGA
jgi:hypothetical protein